MQVRLEKNRVALVVTDGMRIVLEHHPDGCPNPDCENCPANGITVAHEARYDDAMGEPTWLPYPAEIDSLHEWTAILLVKLYLESSEHPVPEWLSGLSERPDTSIN